eukprot:g3716.t1
MALPHSPIQTRVARRKRLEIGTPIGLYGGSHFKSDSQLLSDAAAMRSMRVNAKMTLQAVHDRHNLEHMNHRLERMGHIQHLKEVEDRNLLLYPSVPRPAKWEKPEPFRCPSCGSIVVYPSPAHRSLYKVCDYCLIPLDRLPGAIADPTPPHLPEPVAGPRSTLLAIHEGMTFKVLAATFGDLRNMEKSIDVTSQCQTLVNKNGTQLYLPRGFDCGVAFEPLGDAQAAGAFLRIRATIGDDYRRYEVAAECDASGRLKDELDMKIPDEAVIKILPTSFFGHFNNVLMQYPVAELLQSRVDFHEGFEGRYFEIGKDENLADLFGDPYKGAEKFLVLDAVLRGFRGEIVIRTAHGFMHEPIEIVAPILKPWIQVIKAEFGVAVHVEPHGRKMSARERRAIGEDTQVRQSPTFKEGKVEDVTAVVQALVDAGGMGQEIFISSHERLIDVLGVDPCPGSEKVLHIFYDARGIPSRRVVHTTPNGEYLQETLRARAQSFRAGRMNRFSRSHLQGNLHKPRIVIDSAIYGHKTDKMKQLQVTQAVQHLVDKSDGRMLRLDVETDLNELFGGDPNPRGLRAELKIRYHIPSFFTRLCLRVRENKLGTDIKVGWPTFPCVTPEPLPVTMTMTRRLDIASFRYTGDYESQHTQLPRLSGRRPPAASWGLHNPQQQKLRRNLLR